jgi:NAD kinase
LNLLAFKKTTDNAAEYTAEKAKVSAILKDKDYKELMKLNSEYGKGVIKYLGEDDAIDEVVIYGSSDDKGFALIRVLGDDMNPAHIMQLMQAIQKADYDEEALGEIGKFLKG